MKAKKHTYHSRRDRNKEVMDTAYAFSRMAAAEYFAQRKSLNLKLFLLVYEVSR